jgi:hypothetical protein
MLNDIRILRQEPEIKEGMKYIPKDYVVGARWYAESAFALEKHYETVVRIGAFDTKIGENVERYITVKHETLLVRREIEEAAEEALLEVCPHLEVFEAMPVMGRRSR